MQQAVLETGWAEASAPLTLSLSPFRGARAMTSSCGRAQRGASLLPARPAGRRDGARRAGDGIAASASMREGRE